MALDNKKNIKKVILAKNIARTFTSGLVSPTAIADGEVLVTDVSGNVLNTTTVLTADTIKIVQGRGASKALRQESISLADLAGYSGKAYSAAVEQVGYIGFNAVTGAGNFDATLTNTNLIFRISRLFNTFVRGNQLVPKYGQFTIFGTAVTAQVIATGLLKSLLSNFAAEYKLEKDIRFERVANGTYGTTTASCSVVYRSTTVTGTGVGTNNPVGSIMRIGASNAATTPVYVVASVVDANTIELDVPWRDEAATVSVYTNTVAPTLWGIKMTGQPNKFDVNRWRQYDKIRWNVTGDPAVIGSTTITPQQVAAFDGVGVYAQVAEDEYISWGDEGQYFIDQTPPQLREQDVELTGTYSCLNLKFINKVSHLVGAGENEGNILIYLNKLGGFSTNIIGLPTSVVDVIDIWAQQKGFASQIPNI